MKEHSPMRHWEDIYMNNYKFTLTPWIYYRLVSYRAGALHSSDKLHGRALREATGKKKQLDFGFLLKGGGVQPESKVFRGTFQRTRLIWGWGKKFLEQVQRYRGGVGVKAVQQKSKVKLLFFSCGFPKVKCTVQIFYLNSDVWYSNLGDIEGVVHVSYNHLS